MQVNDYLKLTGVAFGLSAGIFVSYKIYKSVSAKLSENNGTKDYKKEINKETLSFQPSVYETMSGRIAQALDQPWNDDEQTVYDTLNRLKTKSDWLQLVKTFGKQKRSRADWFGSPLTLPQYIEEAMEFWEKNKVKEILDKIGVVF